MVPYLSKDATYFCAAANHCCPGAKTRKGRNNTLSPPPSSKDEMLNLRSSYCAPGGSTMQKMHFMKSPTKPAKSTLKGWKR